MFAVSLLARIRLHRIRWIEMVNRFGLLHQLTGDEPVECPAFPCRSPGVSVSPARVVDRSGRAGWNGETPGVSVLPARRKAAGARPAEGRWGPAG